MSTIDWQARRVIDAATARLFQGIQSQSLETCELALYQGASPVAINPYGLTPLAAACAVGSEPIAALLLPLCDPQLPLTNWGSPLMEAARGGSLGCLRLLLPVSRPTATDSKGRNALMHACAAGHAALVAELLPVSNIEHRDQQKRCALGIAIQGLDPACVSLVANAMKPGRLTRALPSHIAQAQAQGAPELAGLLQSLGEALALRRSLAKSPKNKRESAARRPLSL